MSIKVSKQLESNLFLNLLCKESEYCMLYIVERLDFIVVAVSKLQL
jgi:hypothetical protein